MNHRQQQLIAIADFWVKRSFFFSKIFYLIKKYAVTEHITL
jgi:hypothetical protein